MAPTAATQAPTPQRSYILIVDDDPDMCNLLAEDLAEAGYRTTTASDGWQAVVQVEGGLHVSLIIMDLLMPGSSGIDGYNRLRASQWVSKDLPVMFITGCSPEKALKLMPRDARTRLLFKPFSLQKMYGLVQELAACRSGTLAPA